MAVVPRRAASAVLVGATEEARAREFRRAYRHSRLVRVLRIALPVTAVALFATYGLSMRMTITDDGGGALTVSIPTLIGEDLTMNNPQYEGFNKDGSRYIVRSETARQDIRQTGPIRLEAIHARLLQADKSETVVKARQGSFEVKSGVLQVFDGIDIASQTGMTATLTTATIRTKESVVVSDEPVLITMPTGQLRGNRMQLDQKSRKVAFTDGVSARLVPEQKPSADPAAGASAGETAGNLLAGSNAPVDIVSDRLDLDDNAKLAVFRGQVRAVQADAILEAPELEVHYDGAPADGGAAPAASPVAGQGRLKRLVARPDVTITRGVEVVRTREALFDAEANAAILTGGVLVVSPPDRQATGDRADVDTATNRIRLSGNVVVSAGSDRRATAEAADIDQKSDVAVLSGRVVVTQGENVLRGARLSIDRKAGTSEMIAPGGRVTARFVRPQTGTSESEPAKRDATAALGSFSTDPNAPIDLDADTLVVNDGTKTATFRGDVRAVQGSFIVRTPEMVATYTGQGGMADAPAAADQKKAAEPAQLQSIRANRKVLITSSDSQSVTGDWALFDVKANTVTVGGDVVLTQGRNVIRGPRLVIDMATGQSRMEQTGGGSALSAAAPAAPAEAPARTPTQASGPSACAGRMCAVFYPKDVKDLKEKRDPTKGAVSPPPGAATSGWNVRTQPSVEPN